MAEPLKNAVGFLQIRFAEFHEDPLGAARGDVAPGVSPSRIEET